MTTHPAGLECACAEVSRAWHLEGSQETLTALFQCPVSGAGSPPALSDFAHNTGDGCIHGSKLSPATHPLQF